MFFAAGALVAAAATALWLKTPAYKPSNGSQDRAYWVALSTKIARPVLQSLAENKLHQQIPKHEWEKKRWRFSPQEAFARTLAGMAPWLELGLDDTAEGRLRAQYITLAVAALTNATTPGSADFMDFSRRSQALVEAAYISHALLRAPKQLWGRLTPEAQANVITALKASRTIKPAQNNWLLFPAMVETALWQFTGEYNQEPIDYAIKKHKEWYAGDGTYGDGRDFAWSYYNSYSIHPMLLDILRVAHEKGDPHGEFYLTEILRAQRYAAVLERMISPEATFPVIGRSSAYRIAAFQLLGQVFLQDIPPPGLSPGSARAAMTAVMRRMMEAPGTFDARGWLQLGAVGHQPGIHEHYNSTGALYISMVAFLPLGLPPSHAFWAEPGTEWTQMRIWSGAPEKADTAYEEPKEKD